MLNPDELIETGFSSLRVALPSQTHAALVAKSRRRETMAKVKKAMIASTGCLAIAGVFAVALKPTSALAALKEAARLSAAQPVVHIHFDNQEFAKNPTTPPWPKTPSLDIWKFHDRYFRKQGYGLSELFQNGKLLAYDSRFTEGFLSTYDAKNDKFWKFDGTIGLELDGLHRNAPTVQDVVAHGKHFTRYEWQDTNAMDSHSTEDVFVDPQSKLISYSEDKRISEYGDVSQGGAAVEYPSSAVAARELPKFPGGLKFRTKEELLKDFQHRIARPEQGKTLAGIRTTLYGVVIYPNVPDGIGVDVITTGGAGPDYGSGHRPEIVGAKLLDAKKSDWFPVFGDHTNSRYGREQLIGGRRYTVNQSNDLLMRAPTKITVRVPVWRLGQSTVDRNGKSVHPHDFVGFVTFTTSKLFFTIGGPEWSYYQDSRQGPN